METLLLFLTIHPRGTPADGLQGSLHGPTALWQMQLSISFASSAGSLLQAGPPGLTS